MFTPLHEMVVAGHIPTGTALAEPLLHAASADCLELESAGGHPGRDCAIQGDVPARSGLRLVLGSKAVGPSESLPLAGLLPAPLERSIWPPPLSDPQVLFQVFRL
jgi:hypothetical protein